MPHSRNNKTGTARRLGWLSVLLVAAGLLLVAVLAGAQKPGAGRAPAWEIPIAGAIGPATSSYVTEELEAAAQAKAPVIILRIDTPGGLSSAMRDIVQGILASPVPVIGYVGPSGARAASAGAYILYATHIAAMAPATNVGAATPVTLGGGGSDQGPDNAPAPKDNGQKKNAGQNQDKSQDQGNARKNDQNASEPTAEQPASGNDNASAERRKMVNDAVAYIRSLAEKRGRNADWAEKAVRDAASLSAQAALSRHVIGYVADNEQQLLQDVDGQSVTTTAGKQTLATAGLAIEQRTPGWRTELLSIITNPNIAYILFLVGIGGLVFEGLNPGAVLPGVVGAVCLISALFAFQVLPVNYAGLALMVLGIALMIAEGFAPSFGALGLSGIAAFIFGSVMLMDRSVPGYSISIGVIVTVALAAIAVVALTVTLFLRSRQHRVHTGREGLIGAECAAMGVFDNGRGRVWLHGESWRAYSDAAASIARGDALVVTAVEGLSVQVSTQRVARSDNGARANA